MSTQTKKQAIRELLNSRIKSAEDLMLIKRRISKKYGIEILQNSDILQELSKAKIKDADKLKKILRKRAVRTMSGIAPVAVLTKRYPCPGECVYCPTERQVPQSYLSNEPAVMRAIRCGYDPYKQVQLRLRALEANGHEPTKIELIVIGGTWSVLPRKYKFWYIANCFKAANEYSRNQNAKCKNQNVMQNAKIDKLKKVLFFEQKRNERAKYKIIGLTLETRPDYISDKELLEMRELGCTRVEIGVQATDDKILKLNKRGHGVDEIARATKLLKDYGFKVTYHIMPGLPGSIPAKDLKMFQELFKDERFQPDQIKFYPTVVTKGSLLYKWWKTGKYKPYSDKVLKNLIIRCKAVIPEYVRVIRLIRDIPGESIMAGNRITNLRQVMQDRGVECKCIRCREVRNDKCRVALVRRSLGVGGSVELQVIKYQASGGQEYFLQYTDKKKRLFGFCRLRLGEKALVRELHVYGELVPIGGSKKIQHAGLGKKLLAEAERIAKKAGYTKIIIISGVGVREYYRKLGYRLEDTYMVKKI